MIDVEGKMFVDLNILSYFEEGFVRIEYGYFSFVYFVWFFVFMDENLIVNGSVIL